MPKLRATVALAAVLCLAGCNATPEQIQSWKDASTAMSAEIASIQGDLYLVEDPIQRAELQAKLNQMAPIVDRLNDAVQQAETGADMGWGLAEAAAGVATGFFPMLAPLWLAVRAARRQRQTVSSLVKSVNAGGGPKDPAAAKDALQSDPVAYATFKEIKNGVR